MIYNFILIFMTYAIYRILANVQNILYRLHSQGCSCCCPTNIFRCVHFQIQIKVSFMATMYTLLSSPIYSSSGLYHFLWQRRTTMPL